METVYIYACISAGTAYYVFCVAQIKGFIERDGFTRETLINCLLTPFMPVFVPLMLVAYSPYYIYEKCFAKKADNENQQSNERFEGFQERIQNTNTVENN